MHKDRKREKLLLLLAAVLCIFLFLRLTASRPEPAPPETSAAQTSAFQTMAAPVQTVPEPESTAALQAPASAAQTAAPETTAAQMQTTEAETTAAQTAAEVPKLYFRNKKLLNEHYEKHGIEMGFASAKEYQAAAAAVTADPRALHKTQSKDGNDGDEVYFIEETGEFVVVSRDGYIRTYFCPSSGKKYYDRQ